MKKGGLRSIRLPPDFFSATQCTTTTPLSLGGSQLLGSKPVLGQLGAQTAALGYRPLPGAWSRVGFYAIPAFLLLAFLLPILTGAPGLRRRRLRGSDRLLTCYRLPLLMRGTASLLAATTLLASLPFDTLAGESDLYARLDAANWGRAGSVTLYSYDDNGSLVGKSVTGGGSPVVETYSYDLQGRLARHVLTESDGADETVSTTDYRHNSEGIEVGRTTAVTVNGVAYPDLSETVNYLIDSANPTGYAQVIEERDGDGTLLKSYAIGDDVLSQSVPSSLNLQPSYFLYDGHGSTRQLADAAGDVTAQYTYDAYGMMLGQTAGAQARQATDLLYSGERFDPALQQYYLRARHYNQANGQFTSPDPYSGSPHDPQSLHKYAYCHADPVNAVDPSGEMTLSDMMAGVAAWGTVLAITAPNWIHVAVNTAQTMLSVVTLVLLAINEEFRISVLSTGPDVAPKIVLASITQAASILRSCHGFFKIFVTKGAEPATRGITCIWSGGDSPKAAARGYAESFGGKTLEMTKKGHQLEIETADIPWSDARPMWATESVNFMDGAHGTVHIFLGDVKDSSIYIQYEWPALCANKNVTGVVFHFVE